MVVGDPASLEHCCAAISDAVPFVAVPGADVMAGSAVRIAQEEMV
jgi:hypothetical protein